GYTARVAEVRPFIETHGSGMQHFSVAESLQRLSHHFEVLSSTFRERPTVIGLALVVVLVSALLLSLRRPANVVTLAVIASAALLTFWWVALSSWSLYRHAIPGYAFVCIVCAYVLVEGMRGWQRGSWIDRAIVISGGIAALVCIPVGTTASPL